MAKVEVVFEGHAPRRSKRNPLDWYIEVCAVCGCQLGPGIGSRTSTGRCVEQSHWGTGGMVIRVVARPDLDQEAHTAVRLERMRSDGVQVPQA